MNTFSLTHICSICHKEVVNTDTFITGFGHDEHGEVVCYRCCGYMDRAWMMTRDRITLYLVEDEQGAWYVSNWPGTLKVKVQHQRIGKHNWAGRRYDVWFSVGGRQWHGVQYGDNTQVLHCQAQVTR